MLSSLFPVYRIERIILVQTYTIQLMIRGQIMSIVGFNQKPVCFFACPKREI